jgi:hypothetical protein
MVIQSHMSCNKGITKDGFSDRWFKTSINFNLINDLWNANIEKGLKNCYEARLVPLNKNYPDIGRYDQFRPIAILSAMVKYLELRFLPKLEAYMVNKMDPN